MNEILLSTGRDHVGQRWVCNEDGLCFWTTELDQGFLTYNKLSEHFNVNVGNPTKGRYINRWLRFKLDGKEIIISKIPVRSHLSWDSLYSRGLVYGVDSEGTNPTGTPTNQNRTIQVGDKTFRCRLLKGSDGDPFQSNLIGNDLNGSTRSEWSRIFYPIVSDDASITSYTGPRLGEYRMSDLHLDFTNTDNTYYPGSYNWCQERHPQALSNRVCRGYRTSSYLSRDPSNSSFAWCGWRPVLELVT